MKNITILHLVFVMGTLLLFWTLSSCSRSKKVTTKYPPPPKHISKSSPTPSNTTPNYPPKTPTTSTTVRPKSPSSTTATNKQPPKRSTLPPGRVITPKKDIPPPVVQLPAVDLKDPAIIKKAQVLLYLHGFPPGKVDGTLKEETITALQSFQKQQGLGVGEFNQKTAQHLGVPLMDFKVSDIQTALDQKGFDAGPIDNLVGKMTKGAYVEFLQQNNFPTTHLTPAIKQALFSTSSKYRNNASADALMEGTDVESGRTLPNPALTISLKNASVQDIKQALLAKGYDPGPENGDLTPQLEDALFRYQVDHQLPVGGMNKDTLLSLGFK